MVVKFLMEMIGESTGIIQINTYNIFGKSAFKKKIADGVKLFATLMFSLQFLKTFKERNN